MKTTENYRIRREAMDAAVFTIGPHARHGFEYTTVKCDGRWLWKPTDEVPPLTAAQIKAEGGKRCLINPTTGGTAMAKPDDTAIAPACNGLDIATQAGVAFAPKRDPLDIPGFLKREASPEEMDKVRKKLAKAVGPDRVIKNPPDTKAAERRAEKRKTTLAKFEATLARASANSSVFPKSLSYLKPDPTKTEHANAVKIADLHKTEAGKANAKTWDAIPAVRRASRKAQNKVSGAPVSDSPKRAKRAGKAPTKTAGASSGKTKTALVGELLTRKEGCTTADVLALTGWPSVSLPAQAKACGLTLRKEKVGSVTRYWGSK
jgi:hypothetical protein